MTQYALWFGDKNAFDLYRLQNASDKWVVENEKNYRRNQALTAKVNDLKNAGESVETIARQELGLIKDGETFYQIIE